MQFLKLTMAMTFALFVNTASAITVSLSPTNSVTNLGDPVNIDLVISDLGAFAAPSLGAFYLEVAYDDSIISFDSVVYSDFLGAAGIDSDFFTTDTPGFLELENFSFLLDFELDALQNSSFTLATMTFNSAAIGISPLSITPFDFATAAGNDITTSILVNNGTVEVIGQTNPVPTPTTLLLMLSSFLLFGTLKRQHPASFNSSVLTKREFNNGITPQTDFSSGDMLR